MTDVTKTPMYQMIDKVADSLVKKFYANELPFESVLNTAQAQLKIALQIDGKLAGKLYNVIGIFHYERGSYEEAIQSFISAQETFDEANHQEGVASAFNNIGEIHRLLGNYLEALRYYRKSREITEIQQLPTQYAYSLSNEAFVHIQSGELELAHELYELCLNFVQKETGAWDKEFMNSLLPEIYCNMGRIYAHQHKFTKAREYVDRAEVIGKQNNNLSIVGHVNYVHLHICFCENIPLTQAGSHLNKSLDAFSQLESNHSLGQLYQFWAQYCKHEGKLQQAVDAYQKASHYFKLVHLPKLIEEINVVIVAIQKRIPQTDTD